ncbi:MAG: hypothetical protein WC759_00115, partial [Candidatus Micrarchaeia archaeon]
MLSYPEIKEEDPPDILDLSRAAYASLNNAFWDSFTPHEFPFTYEQFARHFRSYVKEYGLSNKTVFLAIHYAVAAMMKKDLSKVKWIAYHAHASVKDTLRARADFAEHKAILTVRDPRAAAFSNKKCSGSFPACRLSLDTLILDELYGRAFLPEETLVVRHEDLHQNYGVVRQKICDFLKIPEDPAMNHATYFGVPWDGCRKTGAYSITHVASTTPDPRFVSDEWKDSLSSFELFYLQNILLGSFMRKYGYARFKRTGAQLALALNYN